MSEEQKQETAISKLARYSSRLADLVRTEDIYRGIGEARHLANKYGFAAQRIHVAKKDHYGPDVSKETRELADALTQELERRFRVEAEAMTRKRLIEIAGEIETIRAILPQLAAKAAIEAGVIARETISEAEGDAQHSG